MNEGPCCSWVFKAMAAVCPIALLLRNYKFCHTVNICVLFDSHNGQWLFSCRRNWILIIKSKSSPDNRPWRPRGKEEMYSCTLSLTSVLDGVGWSTQYPGLFAAGKRPNIHCTRGRVDPGPVWTGAERIALTGIRSTDRPARNDSLYRLHYPDPRILIGLYYM